VKAYAHAAAILALASAFAVAIPSSGARAAQPGAQPAASTVATPDPIRVLDCLTFGPTETDLEKLRREGLTRWLDGQLHPPRTDALPPAAQAQIDSLAIAQKPMAALVADIAEKGKALRDIADPDLKRAAQQVLNDFARQAATRDILRDLYAPTQLRERMTWFSSPRT